MRLVYRYVFVSLVLFALGCSSGKKAYERGDYYDAVLKAVNRIRKDPDHSKSRETLKNAYPLALQFFETQAQNEIASNTSFRWKNVIGYYNTINNMYEQIRQCPGCLQVVSNPKNYY